VENQQQAGAALAEQRLYAVNNEPRAATESLFHFADRVYNFLKGDLP